MKNIVFVKCIICEKERSPFLPETALLNIVDAYPASHITFINKKGEIKEGLINVFLCKKHYESSKDTTELESPLEKESESFLERTIN